MVGVARGFKGAQAFDGSGFRVVFDRPDPGPFELLQQDAVIIRGASVEAVVETTNQIKEQVRDYIDAHFTGSEFHGNGRRRVSNASAQSVFYDDIEAQGQYSGLVYSKFGYGQGGSFVDFLLMHVRGGTIKPKNGNWLRIRAAGTPWRPQSGFFAGSQRDIFFTESKDGKKLYQLRRERGKRGRTELLATLVKQVKIPASLSGIDAIAARRGDLFERNFTAALRGSMGQTMRNA